MNKIHIGAFRSQFREVSDATPLVHNIVVFYIVHRLHIVWHTRIEQPPVQHLSHTFAFHISHTQLHLSRVAVLIPLQDNRIVGTVGSQKMIPGHNITVSLSTPLYALHPCKNCNAPPSVAAHVRLPSIRVIIVHHKIAVFHSSRQCHQTICPNPSAPMAYLCYQRFCQVEWLVTEVNNYKIICRSIVFLEFKLLHIHKQSILLFFPPNRRHTFSAGTDSSFSSSDSMSSAPCRTPEPSVNSSAPLTVCLLVNSTSIEQMIMEQNIIE